jgi:hypothetical protein
MTGAELAGSMYSRCYVQWIGNDGTANEQRQLLLAYYYTVINFLITSTAVRILSKP